MKSIKELENGILPSMAWEDQIMARILIEILRTLQSIDEMLYRNSAEVEDNHG